MALVLDFSVLERNDNKLLTITDTAGTYHAVDNPTGWGAPNLTVPGITDIAGAQSLTLDITITTSDGTQTVYDTIDCHSLMAHHVDVTDLVFALDCSDLIDSVGGTALGTADDEFPDGIYSIVYTSDGAATAHTNVEIIYGKVKNATYELLRQMNTSYEYESYIDDDAILAIFAKTYLDAILTNDPITRETSVLGELYTLERLLINESTYEV